MLNSFRKSGALLFLSLFLFISNDSEANTVRSLAVFKHLNAPLYFAALYSDRTSDSLTALRDNSVARSMEYRFTADRISMRSFSRQLLERLLINNSSQDLDRHSSEIQRFIQVTRQRYEKGDRIEIVFDPDQPVAVKINSVTVAIFSDKGIFNVFLNGWIGEKLQGQTFYKELSSSFSNKRLAEFDRLVLNAKRVTWAKGLQVLGSKSNSEEAVAEVQQEAPVIAKAKPAPKKVVVAKKKPQPKPKVVAKKPVSKPVRQVAKKTVTKPPVQKKIVAKAQPKPTKPPVSSSRQVASLTKKTNLVVEKTPPKKVVPKKVEPKKPSMNPLLRELFDSYLEELKESIGVKVTPWPPRNLRKIGKGDMVVEVTVNREGAVVGTKMKDNPLGKEMAEVVVKSLKKVSTLPKAPQVLPQGSFVIEAVFNFKKCKRTPSAWLCF